MHRRISKRSHIHQSVGWLICRSHFTFWVSLSYSAPDQLITAPAQIITNPAQLITAPAQIITAPAKLITAPAKLITAPAQLITAPAQPPATGAVVYTALLFLP